MEEPEADLASQPNDAFVKDVFSDPVMARALFCEHLPTAIVSQLNWGTLELIPGSFVKQTLQQAHTDLLFSVEAQGSPCLLYLLFEHQTSVDKTMPLRLLNYMLEIMQSHAETHGLPLAPVLPLVLHQGPNRWTPSPCFEDMFDLSPPMAEALLPFLPKFRHALIDLTTFDPRNTGDDEKLRILLAVMKLARDKQLAELFAWLGPRVFVLTIAQMREILLYALHTDPGLDVEQIAGNLENNSPLKEEIMSTAAALIAKGKAQGKVEGEAIGKAEGKAEGKAQGLVIGRLTLLQEMMGLPVANVEELSALELADLEQLYRELQGQYNAQFKKL